MNSSAYIERSDEDLHQSRSRSNSYLLTTTSQLEDLHIKPSTPSVKEEGTLSREAPTTTSTSSPFLNPDPLPTSSEFITAPTPQHLTPFPEFSQEELDENWSYLAVPEDSTAPTPLLKLDSVQSLPRDPSLGSQPSLSRSNSFPVSMR
jgi:hypothetical protein